MNKYLQDDVFPKCLKLSKAISLHKKKEITPSVDNYRPKSIDSKIIEHIIKNRLVEFKSNTLCSVQFDFR